MRKTTENTHLVCVLLWIVERQGSKRRFERRFRRCLQTGDTCSLRTCFELNWIERVDKGGGACEKKAHMHIIAKYDCYLAAGGRATQFRSRDRSLQVTFQHSSTVVFTLSTVCFSFIGESTFLTCFSLGDHPPLDNIIIQTRSYSAKPQQRDNDNYDKSCQCTQKSVATSTVPMICFGVWAKTRIAAFWMLQVHNTSCCRNSNKVGIDRGVTSPAFQRLALHRLQCIALSACCLRLSHLCVEVRVEKERDAVAFAAELVDHSVHRRSQVVIRPIRDEGER